jgi:hypothetical protein
MEDTGLSQEDLKKYLDWGSSLPKLYFGLEKPSNGWYKGGSTIYVRFDIALDFEYGDVKYSAKELELMMESTVLHEFVHWARKKKSSKPRHVLEGSHKREAGKSFECKAYGGDITLIESGLKLRRSNIKGGDKYDAFNCTTRVDARIKAIKKKTKSKK